MIGFSALVRRGLAAAAAAASLSCSPSEILRVENPDVIPPDVITTPEGLAALHAGALGDFSIALVGTGGAAEGLILVAGSFSDELGNSETFPTRKEYDQRAIDVRNGTLTGVFRNLHRARRSAELAAETIKSLSPTPGSDPRIPETYSLAGFTYLAMGELYCSGVPVSEATDGGELEPGDPLTTTQLLERSIERFDSALVFAGQVRNLARIGRGRALLDLGRFAEAEAAVVGVPLSFVYSTTHTTALARQQNSIFALINQNERFSVANRDGGNGLAFRDALDPRVPWARIPATDLGFDSATPQFDQGKYGSETAAVTVASGVEAELIRAEVALQAGDVATWLGILNVLRANTTLYPTAPPVGFPAPFPALAPLIDPGNSAARIDVMFEERAFWLYLTGHRLGDLRRLVRQYGRSAATAFPGGDGAPYVIDGNNKGGNFGTDLNLPVPFDETNNPRFTQCLDRNP